MSSRYKSHRVNGKSRWIHHLVWEEAHGPIPEGCEIHHIDGNGNNNALENLQCLTHMEHMQLHAKMRREGTDPVRDDMPGVLEHRERNKKSRERRIDHVKAREKAYREENHEAINERQRQFYRDNHDRIREDQRRYELRHKKERAARNAKWYAENKEYRKEYRKQYAEEHREEISAQRKAHRLANLETIKARSAAYRENMRPYLATKQRLYSARKRGDPPEVIAALVEQTERDKQMCLARLKAKQEGGNLGED